MCLTANSYYLLDVFEDREVYNFRFVITTSVKIQIG